jgi:alpha-glucosidase
MKRSLILILLVSCSLDFCRGQQCQQPPFLKAGDRVALVSPSYFSPMDEVGRTAEVIRSWGLVPVVGPNVGKEYMGKYAGTVEERVSDLRWALADTSIKAIICNRGGYGTIQYIDRIPLEEWAAHPKWLVGFSDITTLHGLLTCAGMMSIHGTMGLFIAQDSVSYTTTLARDLLLGTVPAYDLPPHPQNIEGHATGILVGGNICTFASNLGSQADFTQGSDLILFVEEVDESMHNIDRQFEILARAGILDRCKGVVLGSFTHCGNEFSYESVEAMLHERLKKYNIPLLCDFPAGHGRVNWPLVMGAPVELDVREEGASLWFNIEGERQRVIMTPPPPPPDSLDTRPMLADFAGKSYTLTSPDGRLVAHVKAGRNGQVAYDVARDGQTLLLPSLVALGKEENRYGETPLKVRKVSRRSIDETVPSPLYRQATMRNRCNELTLGLRSGLSLVFRAYDEGVAYRFMWEDVPGKVWFETVEYNFPDNFQTTAPYTLQYDSNDHTVQWSTSFENHYTTLPLSQLDPHRLCFLPLMVHGPDSVKMCLTESALIDYPGLYLYGFGHACLHGEHATLPKRVEQGGHNNLQLKVKEREDYIAEMDCGKVFPWRIVMVGTATEMAANNLSYLLAEPSRLADLSWVKPGKVAWDWWNNWNLGNVSFEAGINNETYKHYIDFASRYGIEYVILDEGWAVNGKADLFQVVSEIDLPMLVDYARERNVGIILWAGHYAFECDMERVCRHYGQMGIKGFKVDFVDRDDQKAVDFMRRTAEMCARYHLVVDFHGVFKPAGFTRTYPNVLNFEGVFGLEQMRWAGLEWDQMRYDCELPFIRQAAGPMDYTPGAMLNGCRSSFHPSWNEPMSQGTRCHQLALYVVLDEPLAMLCDSPTNYDREPGYTRFLTEIPTVWDETRVLQGEVGEYIVTARRKGTTWYIAGITNWTARDIEMDCVSALLRECVSAGAIELYCDGSNAHRRGTDYRFSSFTLDQLPQTIHMPPGGGFVMKVRSEE